MVINPTARKNNNTPLVSVILTCYNYGKYLKETVQNTLASTYPNFEIIIINDGSTDAYTKKILSSIKHKKIKILHQENAGLATARNNGIKVSSGKYFLPLDADDLIHPDYLTRAVQILETQPVVGFVYSDIKLFGEKDDIVKTSKATLWKMRLFNSACGSSLIRRKAYDQTIGYNPNMIYGYEDWDFFISLLENGWNCSLIPEPLFFYRKHSVSMYHSTIKKHHFLYKQIKKNHPTLFNTPSYYVSYLLYIPYSFLKRLVPKQFRKPLRNFFSYLKKNVIFITSIPSKYEEWRHVHGKSIPSFSELHSIFSKMRVLRNQIILQDVPLDFRIPSKNQSFPNKKQLRSLPNRPLKVFMSTFDLNHAGSSLSQYELTLALKKQKIIDPVVFSPSNGPLREAYQQEDIPVIIDENLFPSLYTLRTYRNKVNAISEKIKQLDIDVVYANTLQTFYTVAAAEEIGLPSLWNPRETQPWQTYFNFLGKKIAKKALQCFQYPYKVIFTSQASRSIFEILNTHNNFALIYDGPPPDILSRVSDNRKKKNLRKKLAIKHNELVVLLVATVHEGKGQKDIILAVKELEEKTLKKTHFFIVGDRKCQYSKELHSLVDALPNYLKNRIHIIPITSNVMPYYEIADIFICTSRTETYPRVILEAMSFNLPIITTPVGGIPEQVKENKNALFYNPGDISSLAANLQKLLSNTPLRARLSSNSKPLLQQLTSFDDMVTFYGKIFEEAYCTQ